MQRARRSSRHNQPGDRYETRNRRSDDSRADQCRPMLNEPIHQCIPIVYDKGYYHILKSRATTCPLEATGLVWAMTTVACGNCGATLNEDASQKGDERKPCPVCGSTVRNYPARATLFMGAEAAASAGNFVSLTGSTFAGAKATASAGIISGSAQSLTAALLLQAVIVPGDKTAEGRLIEAVAIPWFDIIDLLKNDPSHCVPNSLDRWEEIIAGAYHKSGFEEVTLTPRSGDHGRDVIAVKRGLGSVRVIDQVKAYKPGHLVTANDVRALIVCYREMVLRRGFSRRLRTSPR